MTFPIRMFHPFNGYTHAHDNSEAERLRAVGWQDEVKEEAAPVVEAQPVERGPGRPKKVTE